MSRRMPFIDLHVHFPMQTPFPPIPFSNPLDNWKKGLYEALNKAFNYEKFEARSSLSRWFADTSPYHVSGFGSVLYDPEDELLVRSGATPIPAAIDHIVAQLKNVEQTVSPAGVSIARNPAQVDKYIEGDQRFIFHTLEGGFSLGGDPSNVKALAKLGVASITPAHLLYRAVSTCEVGVPPLVLPFFKHELDHQPNLGLSCLGKDIVEECFKNHVIVDITHARDDAQSDIFEIADGYPHQPLISSHNSVRDIMPEHLNMSRCAISRIKASGGLIGVIFYKYWLQRSPFDLRDDVQLITDVIDYVHSVTNSYDYVAIGSDLDGFIEPIKICSNYSKMSAIVEPLICKYGEKTAELILYRNALRVLHAGWTGI